ncbi:ABC-type transport system involved in multi-copper enzyme maturation permease subunit [Bacillus thermophilus]|uniref:ABC-type transport system involved in multi-copper enzyme maturation permease subunit n=1 Tax=Siminovitchia thermophila TaxID=1245522 RepID=A0ABS2RA39_9BACI|nr:hypothetical protein [Siminovitchia thermophila]MBM7716059.1 ABC-type transport system involved in multi-copper enzyme maturation permease subunit [Siminovitchia thermophila]
MFHLFSVLLVCGVVLIGLGLTFNKATRIASYFVSVGLMLVFVNAGLLIFEYENQIEENKQEFIVAEANRKYATSDAYVTEKINDKKFEVVAGNKIYHAYISERENSNVKFLEVGTFKEQKD